MTEYKELTSTASTTAKGRADAARKLREMQVRPLAQGHHSGAPCCGSSSSRGGGGGGMHTKPRCTPSLLI